MTREQLAEKRLQVEEALKRRWLIDSALLARNQAPNWPEQTTEFETVFSLRVPKYQPRKQLEALATYIDKYRGVKLELAAQEVTKHRDCRTTFTGTLYQGQIRVVIATPELIKTPVTTCMHKYIKGIMGIDQSHYWVTLDCKLLTLFKEGTITWEQLKRATLTDCSL